MLTVLQHDDYKVNKQTIHCIYYQMTLLLQTKTSLPRIIETQYKR